MAIVLSVFLSGHFYQFVFEWEAHIESNDQPTTIAAAVPKKSALPVDSLPATKTAASDHEYTRIQEGQQLTELRTTSQSSSATTTITTNHPAPDDAIRSEMTTTAR